MPRFPISTAYETGRLDVGDGHTLAWEQHGNPDGKPVICVHGGPGSGCGPGWATWFDPAVFRIVLLDQRNCGNSTPYAGEPVVDLSSNTTEALVADFERLREHLSIDRWMVFGASWGSTLGLAYAETHPERVTDLILFSVVTTTRREVEWITHDMRRIYPAAWERLVSALPAADRGGDIAAAFNRLVMDPDPAVHDRAARAWCEWEDVHVDITAARGREPRYGDPRFRLCFARLVTHYWANASFLDEATLLRGASRLAGIPGALISGKMDVSAPPDIAYDIAQVWTDAELVVADGGHGTGDDLVNEVLQAVAHSAAR